MPSSQNQKDNRNEHTPFFRFVTQVRRLHQRAPAKAELSFLLTAVVDEC